MFRCFMIVCLILGLGARADEVGLIGDALAIENPCGNYIITVERLIGGPPNREEYWDGTVNLQNIKNLTEVVITLYLTAPANVTVDEKDGKLITDDNPYNITFFKTKDEDFNAKFHVQPTSDQEFPILSGLLLNDEDICPNIQVGIPITNRNENNETDVLIASGNPLSRPECGSYFSSTTNEDDAKNWPWNVAIYYNESDTSGLRCSGVYIAPTYVLTTGHCISKNGVLLDLNHLSVDIPYLDNKFQFGMSAVKSIRLHENFTESSLDADVAILQVNFDLPASGSIQPVCLWEKSDQSENGVMENDALLITQNPTDKTIFRSKVTLAPTDQCSEMVENPDYSVLCGKNGGEFEFCNPMEGSGLFFKKNNVYHLIGLLSSQQSELTSNNCAKKNKNIFVDVGEYTDWIRDTMF